MAFLPSWDDDRQRYAAVFDRAFRYAVRHAERGEALEIAHEVAVGMLRRRDDGPPASAERPTNTYVYRAVAYRLRDRSRAAQRRSSAERTHAEERSAMPPLWSDPGRGAEAAELEQLLREVVGAMPERMRRVFVLVREHERSYRDVAEELGIGVGTVHTQLSRASALLRDAVERYRAASGDTQASRGGMRPIQTRR